MRYAPRDPSEEFLKNLLAIIGLAFLLSLFFSACQGSPGPINVGDDTLRAAPPEAVVLRVQNDHRNPVTLKIQDERVCGNPNSYRIAARQIRSGTTVLDTIRSSRLSGLTLCATVDPVPGRAEVPPQFRRFSVYDGAHLFFTVANDLTHSSLWIR